MALPPFSTAMAVTAFQFGIVSAPMAVYAAVRRSKEIGIASLLTFALGFVQTAILFAPSFGWLSTLQYNWLQKALVVLCLLLLPRLCGLSRSDCGFGLPKGRWALPIGLLIGLFFAVFDSLTDTDRSSPSLETILFQLTMPGLQEELLYRGLMLCIWDRCLGRPWKAFGVQFGAGCLITTVLFTLGHLVSLDKDWHPIFSPDPLGWINFVLFCLSMCWLRYKFESVLPAVLAHNADNGFDRIIALLIARFHAG